MMQKHKSVISVLKVFLKNYSRAYQLRHKKKIRKSFFQYKHAVKNLEGLEIGGPSRIFKKVLPIYHYSQSIDGVNFSESTLWEKDLTDSSAYNYYFDKTGTQFIMEATNLEKIQSSFYDFVASSHCLEHTANPLKALLEWKRVVKEDGYLILVLPNKINNFANNAPAAEPTNKAGANIPPKKPKPIQMEVVKILPKNRISRKKIVNSPDNI